MTPDERYLWATEHHICHAGWICEEHPDYGWPHRGEGDAECIGPGMPCPFPDCERSMLAQPKHRGSDEPT